MKRARVIIQEVRITRQGEIKNFQIKLPKNVRRIIAIDTDVRINTKIPGLPDGGIKRESPYASGELHEASMVSSSESSNRSKLPYLFWNPKVNPVLGKLKLRSRERTNIFYEEWLHFVQFDGGVPDMSIRLFDRPPASLNRNTAPKKVDVPRETTLINGLFEEYFGKLLKTDLDYTIKIFVWMETEEETNGVVFDFQQEDTEEAENKNTESGKCEMVNEK